MKKNQISLFTLIFVIFIIISILSGCSTAAETTAAETTAAETTAAETTAAETTAAETTAVANVPKEIIDGVEMAKSGKLIFPEPIQSTKMVNIKDFEQFKKPSEGKELTFALLLFSRGFEWMIGLEHQFLQECEALGVKTIVLDAQASDEMQLNQIQDMITQKVDAIILSPNSNTGQIPGVEAANKAGVLLTTVESRVTGGIIPIYVGYDNEMAGGLAAQYIAEKIGYKGTVLETRGALAALSATGRHEGFMKVMDVYPDITVIAKNTEWVAAEANKATLDVLSTNPDLKAVFTNNDEMQTGVQAALKEVGKLYDVDHPDHIVLAGIDGTPLGLERVRNGIQDICVVQDPFLEGHHVTIDTYNFLMGEDVPAETLVQPYIVTRVTADNPELWGNKVQKLQ